MTWSIHFRTQQPKSHLYGNNRQNRPKDLPNIARSTRLNNHVPKSKGIEDTQLAHQRILPTNILDDSRSNKLALLLRLTTKDNLALRLIQQPLKTIEVTIRDDAREGIKFGRGRREFFSS